MIQSCSGEPLVSVVIPAYKAEGFIEEAIASIKVQSYRPVEVVVVEDCSPDRTAETVEQLIERWDSNDFRVSLVRQPENLGGAAALARGFAVAKGDYLCWLSADDAFVGTAKLQEQVRQLQLTPGISYARSFYRGSDLQALETEVPIATSWDPARPYMDIVMRLPRARLVALLFRNPINGSTVMMDRASWQRFGNFDARLGNVDQDSDMWMRYSALGASVSAIAGPSGFYRIHPGQTSNLREDCVIGAAATRIRMIMAFERTGRLSGLLGRTWPIIALSHRWEWYLDRPIVCGYLCEAGLRVTKNPAVSYWLKRLQRSLVAKRLVDERLAQAARERADATYGSETFRAFVTQLASGKRHT